MIDTNKATIKKFYEAFSQGDAALMASCYHADATFNDPAFKDLKGNEVPYMWQMLLENAKGALDIQFSDIKSSGQEGSANWVASYNFGKARRKVVNKVHSSFTFRDGLIIQQVDKFDFWKWSQMALGPTGYLLGWSSFLKNKVQSKVRHQLNSYIENQ